MTLPRFSAPHVEAHLLLALARPELASPNEITRLLRRGIDWDRMIDLTVEHDVVPFVYDHLKSTFSTLVPSAVLEATRAIYLHQLRRSIQIRGELPRVLAHLDAHGVDALPFKGPVLAALAYPGSHLRTFTDLDLLVRRDDVDRAVTALAEAGFEEKNPLPPNYETTWQSYFPWHPPHGNANGYVRGQGTSGALHVDLHWGLASRYFLFPMEPEGLWERSASVTLEGGFTVRTFSPEDTLLFQCMHAAKDAYNRLSHVCDIAALVRAYPTLDIDWVLEKAGALHGRRMVLLGLQVSHDLLDASLESGTPCPQGETDATARMARRVKAALFRYRHGVRRLLHLCRFHVQVRDRTREGVGAAYHALRTSLQPTEQDRAWVDLPAPLDAMYLLVRPVRYLAETMGGGSPSSSLLQTLDPPGRVRGDASAPDDA